MGSTIHYFPDGSAHKLKNILDYSYRPNETVLRIVVGRSPGEPKTRLIKVPQPEFTSFARAWHRSNPGEYHP